MSPLKSSSQSRTGLVNWGESEISSAVNLGISKENLIQVHQYHSCDFRAYKCVDVR